MPNPTRRKRQNIYTQFPARIIARLFDVSITTVYQWRRHGVLTGYHVDAVADFIHRYCIFYGVAAGPPWHTLVEEDIDPDDETLPVSPHALRYDPPKRPRGRPKNPERHPRKHYHVP